MFFFPYRTDLPFRRIPFVTIIVCLVCVLIYAAQAENEQRMGRALAISCAHETLDLRLTLTKLHLPVRAASCQKLLYSIHTAADPQAFMADYVNEHLSTTRARRTDGPFVAQMLRQTYAGFLDDAPPRYLTADLWYKPRSWSPLHMVSGVLAHGSWTHLLGNLFFFIAFAVGAETVLGSGRFLLVLLALALGSQAVYSLASLADAKPLPTLGLSGVVMGVMALWAFLMPRARVHCFAWLLVLYRRFSVPAWLFVLWYAGWDTWTLFADGSGGGINLVAHVSGAAIGLGIGAVVFSGLRRRLAQSAWS
ncbi:MAG: rhomboid family intramembrane serine protease [Gammaproteobacteria bacterium]